MTECMGYAPLCTAGFYHFFPYTIPMLLDPDGNVLPREGVQTGRCAFVRPARRELLGRLHHAATGSRSTGTTTATAAGRAHGSSATSPASPSSRAATTRSPAPAPRRRTASSWTTSGTSERWLSRPTSVDIPLLIRGQVIEPGDDSVEFGGRVGARFRTPDPRRYASQLVLADPGDLSDLQATPVDEIIDFLAELGPRLALDRNPLMQAAFDLALEAGELTEPVLRPIYEHFPSWFRRDLLEHAVETNVGKAYLDGWVEQGVPGARTRVRAVGTRQVHIIAGNVPRGRRRDGDPLGAHQGRQPDQGAVQRPVHGDGHRAHDDRSRPRPSGHEALRGRLLEGRRHGGRARDLSPVADRAAHGVGRAAPR